MKTLTFAVLFLCTGAIASAQQVTLLEGDTGGPAKTSAPAADDGMPQVIVPKEEAPAAVPAATAPVAQAAQVKKPAKKVLNKKKKGSAVTVSSSTVKSPAGVPAVSTAAAVVPAAVKPAAEAVKAAEKSTAPAAFPFETVKPEEMPAAALAGKVPAPAKPAEAAKPAAVVKPVAAPAVNPVAEAKPVPAVKPAEAAKPAQKVTAAVTPAAAPKPAAAPAVKPAASVNPVPAVKPAEAAKPAPKPEVVQAPPAAAGAGFSVGKTHTVTGGDTLWDLSNKYYKDPYRWGKIYNANLDTVKNPDRIYPKEELVIPDFTEEVKPGAAKKTEITGGDTVKEAEFTGTDVAQAEESSAPAAAAAPAKAAPAELSDMLKEFDSDDLSEEMPADQKEWSAGVRIVPESWQQDGVVSAAEKGEGERMENSLSETGDIVLVTLKEPAVVRNGDYLSVYMRGAAAYDKAGKKIGLELQQAGTLQVLSAEGQVVRTKVIEALTAISKGYVVKKK